MMIDDNISLNLEVETLKILSVHHTFPFFKAVLFKRIRENNEAMFSEKDASMRERMIGANYAFSELIKQMDAARVSGVPDANGEPTRVTQPPLSVN